MSIKIKELKDDAILEIKLNKNFYLMLKQAMFYIFQQETDVKEKEELIKKVLSKDTNIQLNEHQAAFRTLMILLAEIERVAIAEDKMIEREMPSSTNSTPES